MPTHIKFEVRKSDMIKDIFLINKSSLELTRELRVFFGGGYMGDGWSKQKEPSRGICRIIKNPIKGNKI